MLTDSADTTQNPGVKAPALADDLLDGAQAAADHLGLSRRQVYAMIKSGSLPHIQKGRKLFFRRSTLDQSFHERIREPLPQKPSEAKAQREDCCTYTEMVPLFMELFEPLPERAVALSARIKNLLRIGALPRHERHHGKTAHYGPADVRALLVIMELCQLGVAPHKAIELYDEASFFGAVYEVRIQTGPRNSAIIIDTGPMRDAARKHLPQLFTGRRDSVSNEMDRALTDFRAQRRRVADAQRARSRTNNPLAEIDRLTSEAGA